MENTLSDINFDVDIEYSSGAKHNQNWKGIEVEPGEKEIVNFGPEESLQFDR